MTRYETLLAACCLPVSFHENKNLNQNQHTKVVAVVLLRVVACCCMLLHVVVVVVAVVVVAVVVLDLVV